MEQEIANLITQKTIMEERSALIYQHSDLLSVYLRGSELEIQAKSKNEPAVHEILALQEENQSLRLKIKDLEEALLNYEANSLQ